MTPRGDATRRKILDATIELLAERGTTATGFNQVVDRSGVSYGSVYHQFKGGKSELVAAAVATAGTDLAALIDQLLVADDDLGVAVSSFFEASAELLRSSEYRSGCPIGTAVSDGHDDPVIRDAATTGFNLWRSSLTQRAVQLGWNEDAAADFASVVLSLYEGAVLVARADRSTDALLAAARHARVLVEIGSV